MAFSQMLAMQDTSKLDKKLKAFRSKDFRIDQGYLGSGIGALEECLRACYEERFPKINYYIGFAYKILRMPLKTYQFWHHALAQQTKDKSLLSEHQGSQVSKFLLEYKNFQMIAEQAEAMITAKMERTPSKANKMYLKNANNPQVVQGYLTSIKKMHEKEIDRPNSLLFQARMEAYLIESQD